MDQTVLEGLQKTLKPVRLSDEERLFRALFYGDPGAGKTTLAMEIVKILGGDTALVTTDSAWTVILKESQEFLNTIHRLPFAGFSQINSFLDAREEGIEPFASCKNLVWDTVSTGVDHVMRNLVDKMPFDAKNQSHPLVEGWPHYRIAERALLDTILRINKTDMNVIYTAHIRDPTEADTKKKRFAIRPNMPQASYNVVAREVSLIGWLHVEKGKYVAQTAPSLTETAKSQIPTIPQTILQVEQIPELVAKWRDK